MALWVEYMLCTSIPHQLDVKFLDGMQDWPRGKVQFVLKSCQSMNPDIDVLLGKCTLVTLEFNILKQYRYFITTDFPLSQHLSRG